MPLGCPLVIELVDLRLGNGTDSHTLCLLLVEY